MAVRHNCITSQIKTMAKSICRRHRKLGLPSALHNCVHRDFSVYKECVLCPNIQKTSFRRLAKAPRKKRRIMTLKHAAWIHGTSILLETSSWSALRQGFFTTVRPSGPTSGWVHFAIPTPVIVDGKRLKAQSAMIRFSTGSQATIGAFHVYDGEKKILDHNGTNYHGQLQFIREVIPGTPEVLWGTGISIRVDFNGTGPDAYIQLISAGIDFY